MWPPSGTRPGPRGGHAPAGGAPGLDRSGRRRGGPRPGRGRGGGGEEGCCKSTHGPPREQVPATARDAPRFSQAARRHVDPGPAPVIPSMPALSIPHGLARRRGTPQRPRPRRAGARCPGRSRGVLLHGLPPPGDEGLAVLVIEATAPIPGVPAFSPGAFEIPEPVRAGTYTLDTLGQGLASLAAEGGTLYTAARTSRRGEVQVT